MADDDNRTPLKLFLVFEGIDFDFYTLHRIECKDVFNENQPHGYDYNLILHFKAPPYKQIFSYATHELREEKRGELKEKLETKRFEFF